MNAYLRRFLVHLAYAILASLATAAGVYGYVLADWAGDPWPLFVLTAPVWSLLYAAGRTVYDINTRRIDPNA